MYFRLFLLGLLSSSCSGGSSVHARPETVLAFTGGNVILPCSFRVTASGDIPQTVEWSKDGLQPDIVFLYRYGCETPEMKNPAFRYRTSLITKELQKGNISLRISNVQLSDAGKYRCKSLWSKAPQEVSSVELIVGAVSEPKLSVTSVEDGAVSLLCEATCWLPEPEIDFLDFQGNNIPAEPSREDAGGCFTVRGRVTLQDAPNRVTCRVHQPTTNQTRHTEILIPVRRGKSCSLIAVIAVGGTVLLLLAPSCGLAVFLWKRCVKSAEGKKTPVRRQSSDESMLSSSSENRSLLPGTNPIRKDDITIEMLKIEVADLKSKLHEKDDTIRDLQNNNSQPTLPAASTNSSTPESTNVPPNKRRRPGLSRQNSNPAPNRPIHRFHRNNSSPALFHFPAPSTSSSSSSSSSSGNTSKKKLGDIGRSKSVANDQPRPNVKMQRRHSSVIPSSNNRFMPLAYVNEDSEMLIA